MYDKGQNGFGGRDGMSADDNDDIYYSCADIALRSPQPRRREQGSVEDRAPVPDGPDAPEHTRVEHARVSRPLDARALGRRHAAA